MASSIPQQAVDAITQSNTVTESAILLINSFASVINAAVTQALANGATAAELAPVSDAVASLSADKDKLAAAIQANTPGAPPVPGAARRP